MPFLQHTFPTAEKSRLAQVNSIRIDRSETLHLSCTCTACAAYSRSASASLTAADAGRRKHAASFTESARSTRIAARTAARTAAAIAAGSIVEELVLFEEDGDTDDSVFQGHELGMISLIIVQFQHGTFLFQTVRPAIRAVDLADRIAQGDTALCALAEEATALQDRDHAPILVKEELIHQLFPGIDIGPTETA
jgi:hypothetical protein